MDSQITKADVRPEPGRVGVEPRPRAPGAADPPRTLSHLTTLLHGATIAVALACSLAILGLGVWLARSGLIFIRGVDLNVVFTIQKVLLGSPVYTDPAAPPFEIAQYGPLYYLLVAAIARLGGVAPTDGAAITLLARSVAVLLALGIPVVAYRFLRDHLAADRPTAVIAAAFGFATVSPWYFVARPDGLMALALLGALYCVLRAERGGARRTGWLAGAGVLALAALLAKQNGISAAIILLGYLGLRGQWRDAGVVASAFAASALVAGVAGSPLLGDFVRANIVDGLNNGVDLGNALSKTYGTFLRNFAIALALLLYALIRWWRLPGSGARLLLSLGLAWLLVFSTVTGLKAGSAENYYNEFLVLAALAVAAFVVQGRRGGAPVATRFAMVISIYLLVFLPFWTAGQLTDYGLRLRHAARLSGFDEAAAFLRRELAADIGTLVLGPRGFANVLPTHGIMPQPELLANAHRRGTVDYAGFRALVESGRVGYLVHGRDQPLNAYLGADFRPFVRIHEAGRYAISAHPAALLAGLPAGAAGSTPGTDSSGRPR